MSVSLCGAGRLRPAELRGDATRIPLYDLVKSYGEIFDRWEVAGAYADQLPADVEQFREDTAEKERTAAALYPTPWRWSGMGLRGYQHGPSAA